MSITILSFRATAGVAAVGLLLGCRLSAQSYSPMYQPVTGNLQQWICVDVVTGKRVPGASWWIQQSGFYATTNDHLHSPNRRPFTGFQPGSGTADGNGNFQFYLNTTLISQAELYVVACAGPGAAADSVQFNYAVGYSDIYWTNVPGTLYQIGGNTTNHGDNTGNHWMMTNPAYGIYNTAVAYLSAYNPGQQVCVNDMALPFGGKFDVNDDWTSPHIAHDRGSAVDVAVTSNQCPSNYVVRNPSAFLNLCISKGAVGGGVSYYNSTDIHCNWLNPNTYPH